MSIWTFPHPAEGDLRAYLDNELDSERMAAIRQHLSGCRACSLLLDEVHRTAAFAAAQIGALHAVAEVAPAPAPFNPHGSPKEVPSVTRRSFTWKTLAAAAAALMAVSLFIPDVRAAASDWVTIFRVQRAQVLRINPAELQSLDMKASGQVQQVPQAMFKDLVQLEQTVKGTTRQGLTLEQVTGLGYRKPGYLPQGYEPRQGALVGSSESMVRIDVDRANDVLALAGSKARVPAVLKGQAIRVRTGRMLNFVYENGDQRLEIIQGESPELSASGGIDLNQTLSVLVGTLGEEFGLPLSLRSQLASMDFARTIPLPVVDGVNEEVKVKGQPGVYYTEGGRGLLTWVSGHQVRMIHGALPLPELLRIAESLEG